VCVYECAFVALPARSETRDSVFVRRETEEEEEEEEPALSSTCQMRRVTHKMKQGIRW